MIQAKSINHKICPVLTCETCKGLILNYDDGLAVFPMELGKVQFYHKGKCDPGGHSGWWDIDVMFYYLVNNLKIDLVSAEKSADMLSLI